MCWDCDHPESRMEERLATVRRCVRARGWAVQVVERERAHPPWAYTVGLTEIGLPELVVTGMAVLAAGRVLDSAAACLVRFGVPEVGVQVEVEGVGEVEVVKVEHPWAHLFVAVRMFGEGIRALQLVHRDEGGRWPWDRGYCGGVGGQPVFGVRGGK